MAAHKLAGEMRILRCLNHREILQPFISSFPQALTEGLRVFLLKTGTCTGELTEKIFQGIPDFPQVVLQRLRMGEEDQEKFPKDTVLESKEYFLEIHDAGRGCKTEVLPVSRSSVLLQGKPLR